MSLSIRTLVQIINILAMHRHQKVVRRLLKEEADKCAKAYSHLSPDAKKTVDDSRSRQKNNQGS
ncbi:hypothetical protein [Candidatus Nitrosotenuis uzonensis]|uniref:Transposase n=1 Tax=Candidatus Nitrosotenuis uzonensis TaxID=1407055 RepID=A0A812F0K8_9ARCH|nr:hypothetical protein [Candidatus Nitrosotenuis uzonensis]CAE6486031.1 conserved hypothetical protein [Candidatus Nitrosotenuis uzonensis]